MYKFLSVAIASSLSVVAIPAIAAPLNGIVVPKMTWGLIIAMIAFNAICILGYALLSERTREALKVSMVWGPLLSIAITAVVAILVALADSYAGIVLAMDLAIIANGISFIGAGFVPSTRA
jgi:hypothetical protein